MCRAEQAAEERFQAVIVSEAKSLVLSIFKTMRDSSSPAAPQDDNLKRFFGRLQSPPLQQPSAGGNTEIINFRPLFSSLIR
jgi:hypothetical protein